MNILVSITIGVQLSIQGTVIVMSDMSGHAIFLPFVGQKAWVRDFEDAISKEKEGKHARFSVFYIVL